jgi:hypothetical protein
MIPTFSPVLKPPRGVGVGVGVGVSFCSGLFPPFLGVGVGVGVGVNAARWLLRCA